MLKTFFRRKSKKALKRSTQLLMALAIAGSALSQSCQAGTTTSDWTPDVEKRVDALLSQMSLDDKIKILSGMKDGMHVPGFPKLGIPELKFSDGPVGVRCWGKSTAYPVGSMLAATWDANAAREYGKALGRDSRARGVHVLLGPGVDLYRVAQNGRNFEYFGEDPYLASVLAVDWIKGVQSQGVATSVKHYAANDQEIQRDSINTIVDERRLHEICFPPFKAAVQDGNAWTVMAAYNKINGSWCTANKYLLTDVLRDQWGYKGVLMSDWGAVHDCLGPITAGTDLEMGNTVWYTPANIKRFLDEKKVTQEQIDEHVRRILRMEVAMGWLDNKNQEDKSIPLNDPQSAGVALKIAREGVVLLKNQKEVLPLDRSKARNIVVLGQNACPAVTGGGGSSQTDAFTTISLLDAVQKLAGPNVNVTYIPTWIGPNPTANTAFNMKAVFEPIEGEERGVKAEYFGNPDLSGTPAVTKTEPQINYMWWDWHPTDQILSKTYSVRWTGKIKPTQTDDYTFACTSDGARVFLDGKPLFDTWAEPGLKSSSQVVHLEAGKTHDIVVEYKHVAGNAQIQFAWGRSHEEFSPEEERQIANADAVIAGVGYNNYLECEGFDRPYDLPIEQSALLKTVSQINPRTIAVLNSGGNVGMENWIDNIAGLIHAWYPGQNGNLAVAEVIFGDTNPSGKLPDTFEKRFEDSPAIGNYPGIPANGGKVEYKEGIYVGYRYFDKKNIAPRYPFGYGLSYTTFAMNNLKVVPRHDALDVSVNVTNTGKRAGDEVVQLYVRPIDTKLDRPVQELKGFSRVALMPGESKSVNMSLNKDAFATYDDKKHAWIHPSGQYEIAIGSSSRDIKCSQSVSWKKPVLVEQAADAGKPVPAR